MLLPRILTAIAGIPIVIALVHWGGTPYYAFVGGVILLCLYEYALMLSIAGKPVHKTALIFFGAFMAFIAVISRYPMTEGQIDNVIPTAINIMLAGLLTVEVITPKRSLERLAFTMLGIMLIPWTLAHLINIRDIEPNGEYLTIMLFVSVWIGDTAAYFIGKKFGKRKLNAEVSPKKTVAGGIASLITTIIAFTGLKNLFNPEMMSNETAVIIGAVIGIGGQISDLAESVIKRSVGAKDSSSILPGHGGVLDRFDSYLILAPVYYYLYIFLVK